MPRYFITTTDGFQANDEEGVVLPDKQALAQMLRQTLAAILRDEGSDDGVSAFHATAVDQDGRMVMSASLVLTTTEP